MKKIFLLSTFFILGFASCKNEENTQFECSDGEIYTESGCQKDTDGDKIADIEDNCPFNANYLQEDRDNDGIGDACEGMETDLDLDGVIDSVDNCPDDYNPDQQDSDNNDIGDACDEEPTDTDGDGIIDSEDNCPGIQNPDQQDSDNNGIGDACESTADDTDGDGIIDSEDNCPGIQNPDQQDSDNNGIGDACESTVEYEGTTQDPVIIPVSPFGNTYTDSRDTNNSTSDVFDSYPPDSLDESGPEFIYKFTLPQRMRVRAAIASPEPSNVDIDIHLLSSLSPLTLIERSNLSVEQYLDAGTYFLSLDTYVSSGVEKKGVYALTVIFEPWFEGSVDEPVWLGGSNGPVALPYVHVDSRNTADSVSDEIDSYPPDTLDESGPEYVYAFTVDRPVYFAAELLLPEPDGADIDIHLLSSLSPVTLIERDNYKIVTELNAGTYYVVADSYQGMTGDYTINITLRERDMPHSTLFADYMVSATDWIWANYGLLGYDINSVLTHDFTYGGYGTISQSGVSGKTMCVAAVMEIILTAMMLYEQDTGDSTVWDFLPMRSWQYLSSKDIRAHIWVNYGDIDSGGSADALRHFGMGMNVPFEKLVPGSVVNINRTTGTGHAVVFLAFLDSAGNTHDTYTNDIIGFRYFSAQGSSAVGSGGMSYRNAIFSTYGCPTDISEKDCNVIYSESQHYLNTGVIYHPDHWREAYYTYLARSKGGYWPDVSSFDGEYFNGKTTDD
ncbi:MAG: thrombospondin type 3 repeat-containing protein [Deltaproteobacteria bacterium]|nr:thrombospondin type 3 repeat-containing protein [Deltaproteobacteria bacterium]